MACAELPLRCCKYRPHGPRPGGIQPSQGDHFRPPRAAATGLPSGSPGAFLHSEAADMVMEAFDTADMYRNPVMILGDGMVGR